MVTVELKKLVLANYRNISNMELHFDGSSKIVGENRIGKTNTIEALYWLLTDKLLNGSSDIEQLKPLNDTRKIVSVNAEFTVGDKTIMLGKEYKEVWAKTRGTQDVVMTGHTTDYYYNGVKQPTKKAYDQLFIEDFFDGEIPPQYIDTVQMLINPLYLGKMGDTADWTKLRAFIIHIIGDVQDGDVFDKHPELLPIKEDLERSNGRTDQVCKQYLGIISELKNNLIGDDAILQELEKVEKPEDSLVETAKKGIEECDANIQAFKNSDTDDNALNVIDDKIRNLRNEIIELKQKDLELAKKNPKSIKRQELESKRSDAMSNAQDLFIQRSKLIVSASELNVQIEETQKGIDDCISKRLNLIDELKTLDAQIEHPTFQEECPYCHRKYDDDKLEETKNHILEELQTKKIALITKGKENNQVKEKLAADLEELKTKYNQVKEDQRINQDAIDVVSLQIKEIEKELNEMVDGTADFEPNPKIKELEKAINDCEIEKAEIRTSVSKRDENINGLILIEKGKKESFQKVLDDLEHWNRTQDQINQRTTLRETHSKQLARTEQLHEMVKHFIKVKLEMLDNRLASVFGDIRFMLIEPQVNGGYSTVCKPYIKGTNTLWKSGSKSEQLTTGVAICECIKAKLNLPNFPFIFDEGGEVSTDTFAHKFETQSQLICVQVKDDIIKPTVVKI